MNVLGMGPMELLLIVVLALIVFGPAKLPEIMGQVGKAINDFRRATSELSDEFNQTIQAELQETRSVIEEAKSAVSDVHANVADLHASVTAMPAPTRTAVPEEALPAPAANGINGEAHVETFTNGTVQAQVVPPLADTALWSWETSGPTTPAAEAPAVEAKSPAVEAPATEPAAAEIVEPGKPNQQASPPSSERAARDELQPPY